MSFKPALPRLLIGTFVVALFSASQLANCLLQAAYQCDVEECESLLVKCHFTERCLMDTLGTDAAKAKECLDCLEEKAHQCCGCVGLCPSSNSKLHPAHVGNMMNHDEHFFQNFSNTPLMNRDWRVSRLEVEANALLNPQHEASPQKMHSSSFNSVPAHRNDCLVAFIKSKVSLSTCKLSCTSMGAASFRWFRDGCCECIGRYCSNYGIHEPRCKLPS